jgi:hypothetical protein
VASSKDEPIYFHGVRILWNDEIYGEGVADIDATTGETTMPFISPTIGRQVHVYRGMSDQPEPASICYVHNERMINVGGFNGAGLPFSLTSIPLLQDDEPRPERPCDHPYACWMPYQLGQAAKTEEALRQQKTNIGTGG